MKLFSRLRHKAPPPAPPRPAERIASLQAATADVLAETAIGSEDAALRLAAIRLLPDGDALRSLAGIADPPPGADAHASHAARHAAHERLARLVDDGSIDFETLSRGQEHVPGVMAVAALCSDPYRLHQLLARIDDQAALARLVLEGPAVRVRQSAAAAISDPAQLHDLLPRVRGKDKTAYRIIRQKCDALLAEQRKAEQFARDVVAACESLEQHGEKPFDTGYAATLEGLTARWRALAAQQADPQVERRVLQAVERCREVVAAHERDLARQAAECEAERAAREARERELAEAERTAAEQADAEARALAAAAAAREAEERVRAEQRAAESEAHRRIGSLIRLSGDALRRGNSRKAARFRLAAEEAMQAAPAVPPHLARNLQQLDERLNELRQWKDYVVAPKRIELIEEMEALAGSGEEPEELAEHIRALQQEWRTINKGIASDASAEGERFQQAFHAAFKPCQAHFAAQAAMRRENLDARKRVLERLKTFESGQDPEHYDYPLVAQVLREAPREWRSHSPVDRDASRPAEIEFQQALDRLRAIVATWYGRNEADKQALITQARHLSAADDTTEAIEGVKRLQELWKGTGPLPRDRSQALWDEFRGLCDAVFKRRAEAWAQQSASLEAARARALALCDEVEQARGAAVADRSSAGAKVREWNAAFEAIGELPRADARGLHDRFERAISRFQDELARQDRNDAEAAESNLIEAGRHIRAYERAVMSDAPTGERDALRSAAEAFMAGVRRWPAGGPQALKQALARADSASAAGDAAREQALRILCIRCEILGSAPSPPEDAALRSDYQMRLLMTGLGQASRVDDRDWDAMLLEWIGIGATVPEAHEALERRFMRSLAKRPAKASRQPAYQDPRGGDARRERDSGERRPRRDGRGRSDTGSRR